MSFPDFQNFKPYAEKWSVSQCVEHIVLTEKMMFEMNKAEMEIPENPERKEEVKFKGEELMEGIKDRSQKYKSSEELLGGGKYNKPEEALADFKEQRQLMLDYMQNKPLENFRNYISDSPFGPIDAYQSMLFLAGIR